jgi:hypothetical protein
MDKSLHRRAAASPEEAGHPGLSPGLSPLEGEEAAKRRDEGATPVPFLCRRKRGPPLHPHNTSRTAAGQASVSVP